MLGGGGASCSADVLGLLGSSFQKRPKNPLLEYDFVMATGEGSGVVIEASFAFGTSSGIGILLSRIMRFSGGMYTSCFGLMLASALSSSLITRFCFFFAPSSFSS